MFGICASIVESQCAIHLNKVLAHLLIYLFIHSAVIRDAVSFCIIRTTYFEVKTEINSCRTWTRSGDNFIIRPALIIIRSVTVVSFESTLTEISLGRLCWWPAYFS